MTTLWVLLVFAGGMQVAPARCDRQGQCEARATDLTLNQCLDASIRTGQGQTLDVLGCSPNGKTAIYANPVHARD